MVQSGPILQWLEKAHRNLGLVTSDQPHEIAELTEHWPGLATHHHGDLDYEPRSMAVAPNAERVVIGTKGGSLWCSRLQATGWSRFVRITPPPEAARTTLGPDAPSRLAIRGIAFLDDTLVAVGLQPGVWWLVDVDNPLQFEVIAPSRREPPDPRAPSFHLSRYERAFRVTAAGAWKDGHLGTVVVGVSATHVVHVLERVRARDGAPAWRARTRPIRLAFPELRECGRIVGAVPCHGSVWMLGDTGALMQLDTEGAWEKRSRKHPEFVVRAHVSDVRYRRLAACRHGIAVLAERYLGFIPFDGAAPRLTAAGAAMRTRKDVYASWVGASAVDVAVVCERLDTDVPGTQVRAILGQRARADVRIRAWSRHDEPPAQGPDWQSADRAERAALTPDGTGARALHMLVAGHPDGRRWLIAATRSSQVVITPLMPLVALSSLVKSSGPSLTPLPPGAPATMVYWRLRQLQDRFLGQDAPAEPVDEALIDRLMATMEVGETRRLLGRLIRRTFAAPPSAAVLNGFRVWVRCMVRWAHRADIGFRPSQIGSFVAHGIHNEVVRWNQAGRPAATPSQSEMDRETFAGHLELFADFMRKWLVGAQSYGEHDEDLTSLVALNSDCHHSLDALVYETRMLRTRCDVGWRRPGQRQVGLTSTTVAVAQASNGALYVQRTANGAWRAFGPDGMALHWTLPDRSLLENHGEWLQGRSHLPEGRCLAATIASGGDSCRTLVAWDATNSFTSPARGGPVVVMVVLIQLSGAEAHVLDEIALDLPTRVDALGFGPRGHLVASLAPQKVDEPSTFRAWDLSIRKGRIHPGETQELSQWLGPGRSLRSRLNHCTCLHTTDTGTALTVWAGFKDGTLAVYTNADKPFSKDHTIPNPETVRFSSAITSVHSSNHKSGHVLAVGTTEGQVGLFVKRTMRPVQGKRAPGWCPVVLYQERNTPIAGFLDYVDSWPGPDDDTATTVRRLLAVAEDGRVSVFDIDMAAEVHPPVPGHTGYRPRRYPGMRLDRFKLADRVTAFSGTLLHGRAALFTGDDTGALSLAVVVRPEATHGRRAFLRQEMLPIYGRDDPTIGPTRSLALYVGSDVAERRAWLRVLPLPDDAVVEFALWHEWIEPLRAHAEAMVDPDRAPSVLHALKARIAEFIPRGERGYRALKVLWTAAGRIAHHLAGKALHARRPTTQHDVSSHHLDLLETVRATASELGQRAPDRQNNARTHSLGAIADWTLVMMLFDPKSVPSMSPSADRFLSVVRDRLGDGPLQVSERLRHINRALWMALTYLAATPPDDARWPRWRIQSLRAPGGLGEILRFASEAGKNHIDLVDPNAPITLALARCFSLCVLIAPHEAMEVALTVSSDRLFQQPAQLHVAILAELDRLQSQLRVMPAVRRVGRDEARRRDDAIQLLRVYMQLLRTQPEHLREARRRLVRAQLDAQADAPAPDEHNPVLQLRKLALDNPDEPRLQELKVVLDLASWLSYLEGIGPDLPEVDRRWFEQDKGVRYFSHSRAQLVHLDNVRRKLVDHAHRLLQHDQDLRSAHRTCELEQANLDIAVAEGRLFEPERTLFHSLVRAWMTEINDRVRAAVDLGTSFDFYNRHVYRRRADELLGWLTELAMQEAPCWHHEPAPPASSMTSRLSSSLHGRHVVRQVFDGGRRLVESTHLMGTLSMVASQFISSGGALPSETTPAQTLEELGTQVAFEAGLESFVRIRDDTPLLGATTVWHAILWELALNVKTHGSRSELSPPLHLHYEAGTLSVRGSGSFHHVVAAQRDTTNLSDKELEVALETLLPTTHMLSQRNAAFARPGMGLPALSSICGFIGYQLSAHLHLPGEIHWRQAPLLIRIRRRET